ncbi:capsular polysaccharide biosynthesis protein [Caldimonas sp. KR1-144]|uniref:capsular polysaccharide biosynthesis protein n=1 Tax=Caldimonas sp. KR1-144 TaxID=3400911 RepID=UPI003BFFD581
MSATPWRPLLARRIGLLLVQDLPRLLGAQVRYQPLGRPAFEIEAVIGWGLKGAFARDAEWAARQGLPYLAIEDGFLRSVALGNVDGPLSVSVDDLGVYYDAQRPSRLERAIARSHSSADTARAEALAAAWRHGRLSKYNHAREVPAPVDGPFVLVVDQTFGDASIALGLASESSFPRMLEAALDEHPGVPVVLKVHPDVIAGRKRAHFAALPAGAASRVTLLSSDAHPPSLLEAADAVYVVTSQMGFEALMWGKPVRTFGMPFYAGWGLTQDALPAPERRRTAHKVGLPDLVHAALVEYPRYLDPETRERCEPERVFEWMVLQRRMRQRFAPQVQAIAFSNWKKPIAQSFFAGSTLHFTETPEPSAATNESRAVWGRPRDAAPHGSGALLRVEDGFLRSVGLGANWVRPLSWVIDGSGMYYDATAPSDLETLLQSHPFDDALRARARLLREAIVAAGITKYNVGQGHWQRPARARQVVLVPGQVESDASIAYGALGGVRRNIELLRAVRSARPDAYVVYKPHPDVVARKRDGAGDEGDPAPWCDEVVVDLPMHLLLDAVDEIQVITSLAGFEALLRGKRVVCHGSPFYAGWGLTEDAQPVARRTRRLQLDELVAGALILYPTYVSRSSGAFTTPERALFELSHWNDVEPPVLPRWLRALAALKQTRSRWRRR